MKLNNRYPGKVYLLAHSMGSVVAGEALRLAGSQLVNTYVASQAANPAHVYDQTIGAPNLVTWLYNHPNVKDFIEQGMAPAAGGNFNYGPNTPNIYGNFLASNSTGAGRRINYYNPNDYALVPPAWEYNQILKPNTGLGFLYIFDGTPHNETQKYTPGSTDDTPPWNSFMKGTTTVLSPINISDIYGRYDIMAFAAEARSWALGRMPLGGNGNFTASVSLATPGI